LRLTGCSCHVCGMKKARLGSLVLSIGLFGCVAERSCPAGEHFEADACVGADGGMTDGAIPGEDVPASCEVPCGGDTPHCVSGGCVACRDTSDCSGAFCVEGACVACRDDADCDAAAPVCDAGACASCEGQDCSADQVADELAAVMCVGAAGAVRSNYEGGDPARSRFEEDVFAAVVCAYPAVTNEVSQILDAVRDGRTTVDFDVLRACVSDIQNVSGQLLLFGILQCEGALAGTAANAAPCLAYFECASGYCEAGTGCVGTCAPQVATGMPCDDDAECMGDDICAGTCQAPTPPTGLGLGATCTNDFQCLSPLVCRETSTCGEIPGAGMPCNDISFTSCAAGTYCDGTTCRTRTGMGEPCTNAVSCVAGTRCEGTPARCLSVVASGASCGDDVACPAGTACVAAACTALPTIGESCSGACYRGTCVSGTCTSATVGSTCPAGARRFDALDPCGDGSTCRIAGSTWTCEATVADGAACDFDDHCNEPSATCSENDTCDPLCAL